MVTTRFTDFRVNKKSRTGVGFFSISEAIRGSRRAGFGISLIPAPWPMLAYQAGY